MISQFAQCTLMYIMCVCVCVCGLFFFCHVVGYTKRERAIRFICTPTSFVFAAKIIKRNKNLTRSDKIITQSQESQSIEEMTKRTLCVSPKKNYLWWAHENAKDILCFIWHFPNGKAPKLLHTHVVCVLPSLLRKKGKQQQAPRNKAWWKFKMHL